MIDDVTSDAQEALVLSDLVSRVLDRGVSVVGNVVISVAGVDLIRLGLRLDLWAVETERRWSERSRDRPLPSPGRALPPTGGG
jgi:hypothetical protein